MDHDCGWVELIPAGESEAIGRGRLIVTLVSVPGSMEGVSTQRAQVSSSSEPWHGRIDSFRTPHDEKDLRSGDYRARFEQGLQVLGVHVDAWTQAGDSAIAEVSSIDGRLPSVLAEVGGR